MSMPPPAFQVPTESLRHGDKGALVAALHELLIARAVLAPEADPEIDTQHFGSETRSAVRALQMQAGLTPDGIVGLRTWTVLTGGALPAEVSMPEPDYAAAGPFGAALLKIADEEWKKGVHEQPLGSNRGPEIDKYLLGPTGDGLNYVRWRKSPAVVCDFEPGWQGAPWCALFAAWCAAEAAKRFSMRSPAAGWGHLARTRLGWRERAEKAGRLVRVPRAGQVGLILVPEEHRGHTVIIAGVEGDRVTTREGNCLEVLGAKRRKISEFAEPGGFVNLD